MATSALHYHPGGGKEKKIRNDSGCEVSSDDGAAALGPSWSEMVSDWSFKSHSIISQELIRMQETTTRCQREMEEAATEDDRSMVAERWKEQGDFIFPNIINHYSSNIDNIEENAVKIE